jgi:hypothetical protein
MWYVVIVLTAKGCLQMGPYRDALIETAPVKSNHIQRTALMSITFAPGKYGNVWQVLQGESVLKEFLSWDLLLDFWIFGENNA